jgi:hypothetical protein
VAATALEMAVDIDDDTATDLQVNGDIKHKGDDDNTAALVTHVIASATWTSKFLLDAGDYSYRFQIERGGGTFTLRVRRVADNSEVQSQKFDTALGFHRVFLFTVG